ncbi:neutral zinc metallopeptidase [Nonomuraea sediminis]|uniref:neutral zinc metallopeptidase n=1 Tax=Nonomuraea sediminis TaxID=2835864 RepID=UPI001BDCA4F1|nr:neutral zinc metallopeptidase [Nonomuraea sediminis]
MRKLTSLLAAGVVLALAGAGTASAQAAEASNEASQQAANPSGKAAAVNNPLYKTGRLAGSNCSPGSLPKGSVAAYRHFLTAVTNCLNRSWGTQFKKAGLTFSSPRLRIITKKMRTPCGPWSVGADGIYCSSDRTMYMLITKTQLRDPFALGITRLMAHEYGHHVQNMSGIWSYYWAARNASGHSGQLQLSRRSELQAECLSSVFMSTVHDSLPIDDREWDYTVNWFRQHGADSWPENDHGKGPTIAAWMNRGYNSGSPGACNTWKVSSGYVR